MPMATQPSREVMVPYAEGSSVVLAIILQDTILDLHFDSVFDACPICSCNTSIRARELGLYLTPPDPLRMPSHVQQAQIGSWSGFALAEGNPCTCGFRFDSTSSTDVNMLDLLRILCQQHYMGFMVHQIAQFVEQAEKAIK
ncbi:hypothetical protein ANCDUO_19682, partial [Ancylostoma duodenale]